MNTSISKTWAADLNKEKKITDLPPVNLNYLMKKQKTNVLIALIKPRDQNYRTMGLQN